METFREASIELNAYGLMAGVFIFACIGLYLFGYLIYKVIQKHFF